MASSDSSIMSRCRATSMPIMNASDGQRAGADAEHDPPAVRWSSRTIRSASMNGWWYGSEITPVPRRMRCVRWAHVAMNTSGEAMIS